MDIVISSVVSLSMQKQNQKHQTRTLKHKCSSCIALIGDVNFSRQIEKATNHRNPSWFMNYVAEFL